jgi:uncharacterized protein
MLLDANVLIYAVDRASPHHERAASWLAAALQGEVRVGFPWQTLGAFVRITTHPRAARRPLSTAQAWAAVDSWLVAPVAWVPEAGHGTVAILRDLMLQHHLGSAMTTDAQLAALAIEYGLPIVSADTDFARFPEITWLNPLAG